MNFTSYRLLFFTLIFQFAPCIAMDIEPQLPVVQTSPLLQMPFEVLEHILSFVIKNDPDALGNLARIQEVCKSLAGLLSKDEIKWILKLDEQGLFYKLHRALNDLDVQKVQLLTNLGALSKDEHKDGIVPFCILCAARSFKTDYYQRLLQIIPILEKAGGNWKNTEPDNDVSMIMHIVSNNYNPKLLALLIAYGADVTQEDADGNSPLSIVTCPKMTEMLLKAGAQPKEEDLTNAIRHDRLEIVQLFLDHNPLLIPTTTMLTLTVLGQKDPKLIQLLIDYGANVNEIGGRIDDQHFCYLQPLAYAQSAEVAKILLQAGAQVSVDLSQTNLMQWLNLVQRATEERKPMILVEVLKQRYKYQTALAISMALMGTIFIAKAVCAIQ
jgi:hypothetical protein